MLYYGESYNKVFLREDIIIFSLTSYDESLYRLNLLIPPRELGKYLGKDFDIIYMNYIFSNDVVFSEFFTIIFNLYCGKDVFIAASENDWSENLVQSLMKLIQQRYGYNGIHISSEFDYIYAETNFVCDFNQGYGLINLDQDKARYNYIRENERIQNNQKEIMVELEGVHIIEEENE